MLSQGVDTSVNVISVPERGEVHVPTSTWNRLRTHQAIWDLVERKTLSVKAQRDGSVVLGAGNRVGLIRTGDMTVAVVEKVPGALTALLSNYSASVRTTGLAGLASKDERLLDQVVRGFVSSVREYVTQGRDWAYERVQMNGSVVGGRLLVAQTLRLRASGRRELVAYDKRVISHVTRLNQCVAAALRLTERLHVNRMITERTIAEARGLAPFFEDNSTVEVLMGTPADHARTAVEMARGETGARADVLELAAVVLGGAGLGTANDAGHAPLTWFVNLEDLFERAIRDLLSQLLGGWEVVKGGGQAHLFPDAFHLEVDPDLVVTRADHLTLVGDVKYKDLTGKPTPSDLYQLVAHARALGSKHAFLVYPAASNTSVSLGRSMVDVTVRIFRLDVSDLPAAVAWMMETLLGDIGQGSGQRPVRIDEF